jgi:hypothetical protein
VRAYHLFRKDLSTEALELLSARTNGSWSSGNFQLAGVSASPNGEIVVFDSAATDLVDSDYNGASDVFVRSIGSGTTQLISLALPERAARAPQTYSFLGLNSISADGRFVVSTRFDDPSTYRDTNVWPDVYVSDLWSNTSVAVSVNANLFFTNFEGGTASGPGIPIENANAYERPIISPDGSRIYAVRRAGRVPFWPADRSFVVAVASTNGVFAQEGLVSAVRSPSVSGSGNGNSFSPSVNSNGNLLVVTTTSTDLVADIADSNGAADVILAERILQTDGLYISSNHLISISMAGGVGNGASSNGFISPDSRWVIFESTASNLATNETSGALSLFARDWQSNRTYLVSIRPDGTPDSGYRPDSAVLSGNSRYVALFSGNSASANYSLIVHDLQTHRSVIVESPYGHSASLNHDGRYVAYAWRSNTFASSFDQIYVRDLQSSAIDPVSVGTAGLGNRGSASPLISGDGRYVVFESKASNLVANDMNGGSDIFVRDRLVGVTMLLSSTGSGLPGNGPSCRPVMAADGHTVVFQSFASDLVGGDYNDRRDLFVVKLSGVDTDGDGIDDDWELAYFGDISRDGNGDFDNDGASDRAEFLAGTDPKNDGSVFHVISITPVGGGSRQLVWSGNPARSYRAEFKDDLNAPTWTQVAGTISWNGSVATITDSTVGGSSHRYYRAVRLP